MAYRISLLLLVFVMVGCQQRETAAPVDSPVGDLVLADTLPTDSLLPEVKEAMDHGIPCREISATIDLYEFVNPALERQLAHVADSCFRKETRFLMLTFFPTSRLYGRMPDVDPEQGAPYNAKLSEYHPDYYDIEGDSILFSEARACVKVGKRLCIIENLSPNVFHKTGRRYTERHTTCDYVCSCAEERRYLLMGDDGLVRRVYPIGVFVPNGPVETVLVSYPDEPPQYPGGIEGLWKWLAGRVEWPEGLDLALACFTVELDGSVSDVKAPPSVKDAKERAFIESLRPLLASMPRWKPGKMYGKTFRTRSLTWLRRL